MHSSSHNQIKSCINPLQLQTISGFNSKSYIPPGLIVIKVCTSIHVTQLSETSFPPPYTIKSLNQYIGFLQNLGVPDQSRCEMLLHHPGVTKQDAYSLLSANLHLTFPWIKSIDFRYKIRLDRGIRTAKLPRSHNTQLILKNILPLG